MADIIELLERRDERALELLCESYGDYCKISQSCGADHSGACAGDDSAGGGQ